MKKKLIILFCLFSILLLFLISLTFLNKNKIKNKYKTIKVSEVAHTIFYAPFYISINKGYFKEEKIKIDLTLTPGADKVTASVLSGDSDIGFCGSEATIYVYNSNEKDYLVNFAKLTNKDGSFLVSKKKYKNFNLNYLKGKKVIGGRNGGMPLMTFKYSLINNNINPNKDLFIDTSIAFPAMEAAFINGNYDFVTLFEPNATNIEEKKLGYVVSYIGNLSGKVPYTTFNARKSYIEKNKDLIKKFNNAIQKGLDYVYKTDSKVIAKEIKSFFPEEDIDKLSKIITRYKENEAWAKNTLINKKEFNHIQNIMIINKQLNKKVPYENLVFEGE